jgi:predicted nucleic acid-binding protein
VIVTDTNVIAYLLFQGDHTELAHRVFLRDSSWVVPGLWRSELRNVLASYIRGGHLSLDDAIQYMAEGEMLLRRAEHRVESPSVLRLAGGSGRSAYDCEFVAVADELGVKLVTADRQLARSFPEIAVLMDEFVSSAN